MSNICERDDNGWLVPRDGTNSRKVYDLAVTGMARRDIIRSLPQISKQIDFILWRIRKKPKNRNMRQDAYPRGRGVDVAADHNPRSRPLDENGWTIPKQGTLSYDIYELAIMGTDSFDIVKMLQHRAAEGTIRATLCQIKNPFTSGALRSHD